MEVREEGTQATEAVLFRGRADDPQSLDEVIGQAMGAASVCWSEGPRGVFEPDRALAITNEVINWINWNYVPAAEVEKEYISREVVADNLHSMIMDLTGGRP